MNYAKYILISHLAGLKKEIDLLENEGNYIIEKTPEFLRYNSEEVLKVIEDLKNKYKEIELSLVKLNEVC